MASGVGVRRPSQLRPTGYAAGFCGNAAFAALRGARAAVCRIPKSTLSSIFSLRFLYFMSPLNLSDSGRAYRVPTRQVAAAAAGDAAAGFGAWEARPAILGPSMRGHYNARGGRTNMVQ